MKKILYLLVAVLLIFTMVLSFAACGDNEEDGTTGPVGDPQDPIVEKTPEEKIQSAAINSLSSFRLFGDAAGGAGAFINGGSVSFGKKNAAGQEALLAKWYADANLEKNALILSLGELVGVGGLPASLGIYQGGGRVILSGLLPTGGIAFDLAGTLDGLLRQGGTSAGEVADIFKESYLDSYLAALTEALDALSPVETQSGGATVYTYTVDNETVGGMSEAALAELLQNPELMAELRQGLAPLITEAFTMARVATLEELRDAAFVAGLPTDATVFLVPGEGYGTEAYHAQAKSLWKNAVSDFGQLIYEAGGLCVYQKPGEVLCYAFENGKMGTLYLTEEAKECLRQGDTAALRKRICPIAPYEEEAIFDFVQGEFGAEYLSAALLSEILPEEGFSAKTVYVLSGGRLSEFSSEAKVGGRVVFSLRLAFSESGNLSFFVGAGEEALELMLTQTDGADQYTLTAYIGITSEKEVFNAVTMKWEKQKKTDSYGLSAAWRRADGGFSLSLKENGKTAISVLGSLRVEGMLLQVSLDSMCYGPYAQGVATQPLGWVLTFRGKDACQMPEYKEVSQLTNEEWGAISALFGGLVEQSFNAAGRQ